MREIHHREVIELTEEQKFELEENERKNRRYLEIKPEGTNGEVITVSESMTFWDDLFKN